MADLSWLHAVPIGLLMFAGTTYGVVKRALSKRASQSGFPALGVKLALTHTVPETPGAAGTLKGTYQGHRVRLESETRARAVVSFRREIKLELRNYEHWKRTPNGLEVVAFEQRQLNTWLRNRFAHASLRALLIRDATLTTLLSRLRDDPHLRELTITPDRVEFVFDYGVRGLFPVNAAEQALTTALTLAERIEQLEGSAASNSERAERSGS